MLLHQDAALLDGVALLMDGLARLSHLASVPRLHQVLQALAQAILHPHRPAADLGYKAPVVLREHKVGAATLEHSLHNLLGDGLGVQ